MKKYIKNNAAMLMMAVAVMGGMTSCEEHSDEFDGSLRVGNILLADNSVVSPQGYDADGQQAVGVIFYCNRDTALRAMTRMVSKPSVSSSIATATRLWSSLPMSWAVMPMLTL